MFPLTLPMTRTVSNPSNQLLKHALEAFQVSGPNEKREREFEKQSIYQTGLSTF